jgi:hypothetical protein
MPSTPDPVQYDSFAVEYEEHAAAAPYNALYDRPATLRLVGEVEAGGCWMPRAVLDSTWRSSSPGEQTSWAVMPHRG